MDVSSNLAGNGDAQAARYYHGVYWTYLNEWV
jgi:hypothetical protein